MKFRFKFVFFAGVALCLLLYGCSQPTINDLLVHFEKSGLSVEDAPPLEGPEKEAVENARKALGGRKSAAVERKIAIVDSIKIKIYRYKNNSTAKDIYEKFMEMEDRSKQLAQMRNTEYHQTTYLLKGPFIILIRHWTIKSLDDLRNLTPTEVNVPDSFINKIEQELDNFL